MNAFAHLDLFDGIPAKCPVKGCYLKMTPQELMAHVLMRHRPEDSMLEIGADWHTVYDLDLAKLAPGCNHVVGVIAYAGSNRVSCSRPIGPELQLVNHLPILLMMYISPPAPNLEQMYVLYMISPVASRRVSAHVSLLNGPVGREVRGVRCLRNFLDPPLLDSEELLHSNMDYLIYTATDVWEHCTAGDRCKLQFKVVLQGEPNLFEAQENRQSDAQ
ncbi:uncharacterized protein LOC6576116 [Drosophila mojavensis]|uniref:DUF4729 domain-containing protein n=1 Tax=Drosophila mojavensis TaxID=7230 RepID=B4KK40_DROMO|nr:uncharacterized protein LOC6576116 [Drosophila mojavensis]EDW11558.1 uncharacterized protein Dmoj_GI14121 [Drosophila mojavensis]